jgi:hypothetical protein
VIAGDQLLQPADLVGEGRCCRRALSQDVSLL